MPVLIYRDANGDVRSFGEDRLRTAAVRELEKLGGDHVPATASAIRAINR